MFDTHVPFIDRYNDEMRKSMIDKISFADKFDAEVYVDFGCADGSTIDFLHNILPNKVYVGYDLSEEMIEIAKKRCPFGFFFSSWEEVVLFLESFSGKKAVICNSLIHEVYAYGDPDDVTVFWNRIFGDLFDFIAIRDMSVSRTCSRPSNIRSVSLVRQRYDQKLLNEFEDTWGSITNNWALTHFLLKYRYKANWEREVKENYLPVNLEDLLARIPKEFDFVDFQHYTLPFTFKQVREDFGFELQEATHVKIILERTR